MRTSVSTTSNDTEDVAHAPLTLSEVQGSRDDLLATSPRNCNKASSRTGPARSSAAKRMDVGSALNDAFNATLNG